MLTSIRGPTVHMEATPDRSEQGVQEVLRKVSYHIPRWQDLAYDLGWHTEEHLHAIELSCPSGRGVDRAFKCLQLQSGLIAQIWHRHCVDQKEDSLTSLVRLCSFRGWRRAEALLRSTIPDAKPLRRRQDRPRSETFHLRGRASTRSTGSAPSHYGSYFNKDESHYSPEMRSNIKRRISLDYPMSVEFKHPNRPMSSPRPFMDSEQDVYGYLQLARAQAQRQGIETVPQPYKATVDISRDGRAMRKEAHNNAQSSQIIATYSGSTGQESIEKGAAVYSVNNDDFNRFTEGVIDASAIKKAAKQPASTGTHKTVTCSSHSDLHNDLEVPENLQSNHIRSTFNREINEVSSSPAVSHLRQTSEDQSSSVQSEPKMKRADRLYNHQEAIEDTDSPESAERVAANSVAEQIDAASIAMPVENKRADSFSVLPSNAYERAKSPEKEVFNSHVNGDLSTQPAVLETDKIPAFPPRFAADAAPNSVASAADNAAGRAETPSAIAAAFTSPLQMRNDIVADDDSSQRPTTPRSIAKQSVIENQTDEAVLQQSRDKGHAYHSHDVTPSILTQAPSPPPMSHESRTRKPDGKDTSAPRHGNYEVEEAASQGPTPRSPKNSTSSAGAGKKSKRAVSFLKPDSAASGNADSLDAPAAESGPYNTERRRSTTTENHSLQRSTHRRKSVAVVDALPRIHPSQSRSARARSSTGRRKKSLADGALLSEEQPRAPHGSHNFGELKLRMRVCGSALSRGETSLNEQYARLLRLYAAAIRDESAIRSGIASLPAFSKDKVKRLEVDGLSIVIQCERESELDDVLEDLPNVSDALTQQLLTTSTKRELGDVTLQLEVNDNEVNECREELREYTSMDVERRLALHPAREKEARLHYVSQLDNLIYDTQIYMEEYGRRYAAFKSTIHDFYMALQMIKPMQLTRIEALHDVVTCYKALNKSPCVGGEVRTDLVTEFLTVVNLYRMRRDKISDRVVESKLYFTEAELQSCDYYKLERKMQSVVRILDPGQIITNCESPEDSEPLETPLERLTFGNMSQYLPLVGDKMKTWLKSIQAFCDKLATQVK